MAKYHIADSSGHLNQQVAQFLTEASQSSISDHGYFAIGLSGGSSATIVSKALTCESVCKEISWRKWHVFFCDERYVSLTDPDSNYNSLKPSFFEKVPVPQEQIYTINSELSLEKATADYEAKLKSLFGNVEFPMFDALVLGMGPDGHICSLFPNHSLLDEKCKWIASVDDSPKPPPKRITMTLPVLNHARSALFTVTGGSKADMVRQATTQLSNKTVPASMVDPKQVDVHWFLDKDSAKLLSETK